MSLVKVIILPPKSDFLETTKIIKYKHLLFLVHPSIILLCLYINHDAGLSSYAHNW